MNQRIDELRSLLQDDPGSRRFFLLGDLLRKTGEFDEAAQVLTAGLEHHPRYVAAWVSLGRIQLESDQFSEAERSFARALELDPENAVAARLIGETAEKVGEWVRAIKAFKLARALTPGDAELETRIENIERRLAGDVDEFPQAVEDSPRVFDEPAASPDPFEIEEEAAQAQNPITPAVVTPRFREIISISEDDPFAMTSTGDTGVWMVADDVFAPPEFPDEAGEGDVFGEDIVAVPSLEAEPEEEQSVELAPEPEPEIEFEPEFEPELEPEPEPEPVQESDYSRDISLPTVTLARLALEQDDRPLAEETLKAVLQRDPGNQEAAEMLGVLDDEVVPEPVEPPSQGPSVSPVDLLAIKASKLKGWMENIRTATERRAP